jgi:hypothetical protein
MVSSEEIIGAMIGGTAGAAVSLIAIFIRTKRKSAKNKYDERQKMQWGQAAIHTLIFAATLLVASTILQETLAQWLTLSAQNIFILFLSIGFYVIEQLFRSSYFGVNATIRQLLFSILLGICFLVIAILDTIKLIENGSSLMISGNFTSIGFSVMAYWYIIFLFAIILFGWILERRKNKQ